MKRGPLLSITAALALALAINLASRSQLSDLRRSVALTFETPRAMLPPALASIMACEFNGLISDYMLMEISSFVGSHHVPSLNDYRKIHRALKQAQYLDPYFEQTYLTAQGLLPWQGKLVEETNALLETSRQHRTWDWRPGYYMGFNHYFFLNDFDKASAHLLEASKIKGAPMLLPLLGARLAVKSHQSNAAIGILRQMLSNNQLAKYEREEIEKRLGAIEGVHMLETALANYHRQKRTYPSSLDELVTAGFVHALPDNPYGKPFLFDAKKGRVYFDEVEKIKKLRNIRQASTHLLFDKWIEMLLGNSLVPR